MYFCRVYFYCRAKKKIETCTCNSKVNLMLFTYPYAHDIPIRRAVEFYHFFCFVVSLKFFAFDYFLFFFRRPINVNSAVATGGEDSCKFKLSALFSDVQPSFRGTFSSAAPRNSLVNASSSYFSLISEQHRRTRKPRLGKCVRD